MNSPSFAAVAAKYARDVLAGRVPACIWVKASCRRHLADLARSKADRTYPYRFDPDKAARVCRYIELLPHIKGPKAKRGERIVLEPWQVFILANVFGWVVRETGFRRFRRAYVEVPRGNAKSTLTSGVGLYCTTSDGESGAECYSAATTRDQAKIVWGVAHAMVERLPPRSRATLGLNAGSHAITVDRTASSFKALSRDSNSQDGLNIHFGGVDELHAHRTREMYDVLETGAGKRDQSLLWLITTAGSNRAGICYEVRSDVLKILTGVLAEWPDCPVPVQGSSAVDDQVFGIVYTIDDSDEWDDPGVWAKANPNWGISVMPDYVAGLASKAMRLPSAQANFKTKHLDVWVNADQAWMDMRSWTRCSDESLDEADFIGQPCTVALDLASKIDIAAKIKLFTRQIDGRTHYYAFGTYYLPAAQVEASDNSQYQGWETLGLLTVHEGERIDFDLIRDDVIDDSRRFQVEEVAYDPWQATQLAQQLQAQGASVIEYRNTVANFSAPMKELEALVREGRFHHNGDPILEWMVSNVVCHTDAKDNIYPRKEQPGNKIDGVVASIMALGRLLAREPGENLDDFLAAIGG